MAIKGLRHLVADGRVLEVTEHTLEYASYYMETRLGRPEAAQQLRDAFKPAEPPKPVTPPAPAANRPATTAPRTATPAPTAKE